MQETTTAQKALLQTLQSEKWRAFWDEDGDHAVALNVLSFFGHEDDVVVEVEQHSDELVLTFEDGNAFMFEWDDEVRPQLHDDGLNGCIGKRLTGVLIEESDAWEDVGASALIVVFSFDDDYKAEFVVWNFEEHRGIFTVKSTFALLHLDERVDF